MLCIECLIRETALEQEFCQTCIDVYQIELCLQCNRREVEFVAPGPWCGCCWRTWWYKDYPN